MNSTERLTDGINIGACLRNDVAARYADVLRDGLAGGVTWLDINSAIIQRWSMAGLKYIKKRAWDIQLARTKGAT